jgi:hypothetical protein
MDFARSASSIVEYRGKFVFVEPRRKWVQWVRWQLIGPADKGKDELNGVLPTERFPCGAIYPTSRLGEGIDPSDESNDITAQSATAAEEQGAEPTIVRRYIPPSSVGFSFFITGEDIRLQVLCSASRYERVRERGKYTNDWIRHSVSAHDGDIKEFSCLDIDAHQRTSVLQERAHVDVKWRRFSNGWIVTVTLCNSQELEENAEKRHSLDRHGHFDRAEKTLFETQLRCVVDAGDVGAYPRVDRNLLDEEEQEIELQYANRTIYAVGHGSAADWKIDEATGRVTELFSDAMPVVEVPLMTADTGTGRSSTLSLARLATFDAMHEALSNELYSFVDDYARWVGDQNTAIEHIPPEDKAPARRIVTRMQNAISRMRASLKLLRQDAKARLAFALANQAMLDQMRQHDAIQGKSRDANSYRWRPFQLGFLLTVLESASNEHSEFRDTVDLIWFPTGGGKTEAYLGLIAYQIALRRLRFPTSGGGTAVLMRYTLRLLTRDQFVRATRLICAMELLRRGRNDLGEEPISIGMWVGDATSPNTFAKAMECVAAARDNGTKPNLVVEQCPWCGQPFEASANYICGPQEFRFTCGNSSCACAFASPHAGKAHLPCNVVDEALYAEPPTLLVATLDKFARLAWDERTSVFFGSATARPPELIIQDELHLIAGALGSIAGLYEAALDTVVRLRGLYPKYIASTATIRMAKEQVKRLYGRDVAVFPPPGLNCDDSWFARTVPLDQKPGRIYVGYLAPMLNRQRCLAPLAAALLVAPDALFAEQGNKEALLDAWWTQVVYHGSLKGVGNSHTAFSNNVRDFMQLLVATRDIPRAQPHIEQLTSLQTAEQNASIFARLKEPRGTGGCLDAVLATNMVSVGLDVARLALMVINGQPLTTAEYIQASSRVGRGDVPGIVFANYYRDQARSLSHYEGFRPYHEAFYRFVEPTSVTPYTYQARLRALHSALVIVIRHGGTGLLHNDAAGRFDPADEKAVRAIEELIKRCRHSAPDDTHSVRQHLESLATAWKVEAERCRSSRRQLDYQVLDNDKARDRLLCNHDDTIPGLWRTLQSMRNIENTALLKAVG